ncbi:MAG: aa3-type cytochrome c oxidase subunit IV [Robiginitomaculum sp.]|nr:MAG: aa3-type cytochrome c oxidase subunit IV [Robiginitomaculum sp.]
MASGHSNYVSGEMPIQGHQKTFGGFIRTASFCTAFLIVVLLMPILVFGAQLPWFTALVATVVVGVLITPAFKLGGGWYALLFGLAVLAFIIGFGVSALAG